MPTLSDIQSILLATAAQRESGSIYPLPEKLTAGTRVAVAMKKLLEALLVEEPATNMAAEEHRSDGDIRFAAYVTPAGFAAIGIGPVDRDDGRAPSPTPVAPAPASKANQVVDLLNCKVGAAMTELIEATGWPPHTTRAALSGLRKKGHTIERSKRDEVTCYRITGAEAAR